MKTKIKIASLALMLLSLIGYSEINQVLYLSDLQKIQEESDNKGQVLVMVIPLTQYVQDSPSQTNVQVFFDCEIKIFTTNPVHKATATVQDGVLTIHKTSLEFLAATFNSHMPIYLDARTNNWFSIYYYDVNLRKLAMLEQDKYDSLLEAIVDIGGYNISYPRRPGQDVVPACPYIYICIDGRKFDRNCRWFYAGNPTLEAQALRMHPWGKLEGAFGRVAWVPLEMNWFEEVPDYLTIPDTDFSKATSAFWRLR